MGVDYFIYVETFDGSKWQFAKEIHIGRNHPLMEQLCRGIYTAYGGDDTIDDESYNVYSGQSVSKIRGVPEDASTKVRDFFEYRSWAKSWLTFDEICQIAPYNETDYGREIYRDLVAQLSGIRNDVNVENKDVRIVFCRDFP